MMNDTFWFTILPILFGVAVVALLGYIAVKYVLAARKWKRVSELPVESCFATVLEKQAVEHSRHTLSGVAPSSFDTETVTQYHIVFQLETGVLRTFPVEEPVYDLLAEGDTGTLTFQAERFLKFERS